MEFDVVIHLDTYNQYAIQELIDEAVNGQIVSLQELEIIE